MKDISSDKKDQVLKALMAARSQMGNVKKDSTNPFHKSKYASLSSFIEACDQALSSNGLLIYQCVNHEESKDFLVTTLEHPESGQWIRSYASLLNVKGDSQGMGSAITYMRRYSMAALLNLCPDEDDDGQKACAPPEKKKTSEMIKKDAATLEKIDEKQINELREMIALAGNDIASIVNKFLQVQYDNIKTWKDTPKEAFDTCIRSFKMNIEKRLKEKVA
jgi:hypothetical protein